MAKFSKAPKFSKTPPCEELGPGDGLDPRLDPIERKSGNRKALQLCAQVADALNMALADCSDEYLREAFVESVIPAPDSSHMLVKIRTTSDKELVVDALNKASGRMRNEIANAIHRKKVPQLRFEVNQL